MRALRQFKNDELINLQKLLAATLKYIPSDRVTADDISKLEWIHKLFLRSRLNGLTPDRLTSCLYRRPSRDRGEGMEGYG